MALRKILSADTSGMWNSELADVPEKTTAQMQAFLDSLPAKIIEIFNEDIDALNALLSTITGLRLNGATLEYTTDGTTWVACYTHPSTHSADIITDGTTNKVLTAILKAAYDAHLASTANPHSVTKAQVGLGNVDNTTDLNKPISTLTQSALDLKVDKVTGKGLSTEDYTTAEKSKLSGIAEGAEVNVNADWNASSGDAVILNKPTIPDQLSDLSDDSTHRLVTDAEKNTWNGKQDALGFTPVSASDVLTKTNTTAFTPTTDYHPATKKYVDDSVIAAGGGDMMKATYDPNNKSADAFNMDNMNAGITNKILTDTLKTAYDGAVTDKHTHSNKTALDSVSGVNTGDETGSTIKAKLGITTLSGSNTGDQDLSGYVLKSNVLEKNNTTAFTPDADYEPATKKYVDDSISSSGGGKFPFETLTATWSESVAASTTVTKTISHSLGAIPSKVKVFFVNGQYTGCVEIDYKDGNYNYTMDGSMYIGTTTYVYRKWKKTAITDNYLFGLLSTNPAGCASLGNYNLRLTNITFNSSQITFSIYNAYTSSCNINTSVTVEVYK